MTIDRTIFHDKKSDYQSCPLFLGENVGLLDSIHKKHPEIWKLYKSMKSLDWDENEFDYAPCAVEFRTCSRNTYDMMIKTLAWQWEADSVVAHHIVPIVAPFVSSSELWVLWSEIGKNECLHSLTYSEIVRNSFDNPNEVMQSVLDEVKALQRLEHVAMIMSKVYLTSHKLALSQIDKNSDEAYDAIFMFVIAMLVLERIQFMASFAITFAIADTGMFLPIGKAVQKICTDEYTIHIKADKAILTHELNTERGQAAFKRNTPLIRNLIHEVTKMELDWTTYLFSEGRELVGVTEELIHQWVLYGTTDVCQFLNLESDFKTVTKNPLGYMNHWIDINRNQPAPQEEKTGNYLLSGVKSDDANTQFDVDF